MFDQIEMMKVVNEFRNDAIVVPVFRADPAWVQVTDNSSHDFPFWSAMGKGSSVALGLALAQPDLKVILFDGDGSLLMNLGSLVTIANVAPKNFYHFVMDNAVYATTGGQEIPGGGEASLAGMARSAGYPRTYEFDDLEEFTTQAAEVFGEPGPVLVNVKVHPSIRTHEERVAQMADPNRRTSPKAIKELHEEFSSR